SLDIRLAAEILDKDHFDLEKVKRRILEYLAVLQLKKYIKGPILCFVGPPGVGKTSLGQSIARSMGRKFLRISLGGLRDEAEIRGHRRTYVGALPGRIIQGLRRVGVKNPVFMLDEIDKLGMDFRGDPSSALLEVLDPEQNSTFSDHYLGVPFDLSSIIFIATANVLDPIPPALKDRMEVIEIPGYTEEEKLQIARNHLLLPQLENHGLSQDNLTITDQAILEIIRSYTREAGVRNLDRNLASVCRAIAREVAEGNTEQVVINPQEVANVLGPARFIPELATRSWGPGVATGLAWTPSGGDLIFIEALRTSGSGKLILTGYLGDVMKESATAALTYIRAHAQELGIAEEAFDKTDIHVHVPAGGIPKDGPSAGVALVVALASLISNREIRRDIAMTGEITLRGDVLPVGGIKEKVLAARRAGIREVMIPQHNAKDLVDIPSHLRKDMTFHEIQITSDALKLALQPAR
ncbi:MAG: endopeptidase La, partial [Desulforhabdus sp.]|nr:endopeptidase La [Desulforhabdus sp.]